MIQEEYQFYCPKCGDMHYINKGETKCYICGTTMLETPHEYNISQTLDNELLKKGWAENKHIFYENKQKCFDEVVSKSPQFDRELYQKKDAILKQKEEAFHSMMEAARNRVKCHYCGSTNVKKVSQWSKGIGIWSIARNTKEFHCNNCGADF